MSATLDQFRWQAVGRRKTSVARVYLTPGTGKWDVNGRTLGDYFPRPSLVQHIQQSFTATDTLGAFDVRALVNGGGMTGQAGALRHAIARALVPRPTMLLLDEPTEGIQPSIIQEIERAIRRLRERGTVGILLVEQYLDFAQRLADAFAVMEKGEVVTRGPISELTPDVIKRHLAV